MCRKLGPDGTDVHVDDVGGPVIRPVPDSLDDLRTRQDVARSADEQLQQGVLAGGQVERPIADRHGACRRVQDQRTDGQDRRPHCRASPCQRPQACGQLGERERFDEVVIRPDVQAAHPVGDRIPRGQHEDGRPDLRLAKVRTEVEPVTVRQHDVEDEDVVWVLGRQPTAILDRARMVDRMALALQSAPEKARQPVIVFHQQQAHVSDLPFPSVHV